MDYLDRATPASALNVRTPHSNAIARIVVERLFGQYDYILPSSDPADSQDLSDVFILYGDNGSGKTTLLNLLFHLLSPASKRGHRNAIAETPFKKFAVTLNDGTDIWLLRNDDLLGGYRICVERGGVEVLEATVRAKGDEGVKFSTPEESAAFFKFLGDINLTVYFLSDDRKIFSDLLSSEVAEEDSSRPPNRHFRAPVSAARGLVASERNNVKSVRRAIKLANDWIRQQALRAAKQGTYSAHVTYADLVKQISASRTPSETGLPATTEKMIGTLRSLAEKSREYARFGFTTPLQVDGMIEALVGASRETAVIIGNVLEPYIEGNNARLDDLHDLHVLTTTFVENLNSFYVNKRVTFDLNEGFKVRLTDGRLLDFNRLSSGEKQLLPLFCHALISNEKKSLFLVDEPELSLDVKWQRSLIQALVDIVRRGSVQFILATHSIELLSQHLEKVVKLETTHCEIDALPHGGCPLEPTVNS